MVRTIPGMKHPEDEIVQVTTRGAWVTPRYHPDITALVRAYFIIEERLYPPPAGGGETFLKSLCHYARTGEWDGDVE